MYKFGSIKLILRWESGLDMELVLKVVIMQERGTLGLRLSPLLDHMDSKLVAPLKYVL